MNWQLVTKPVGASLLAMAVYQSTFMGLTHCNRQQAGSHNDCG
jgi:multisubunit Na+/H+ antiporter MnhG subunit